MKLFQRDLFIEICLLSSYSACLVESLFLLCPLHWHEELFEGASFYLLALYGVFSGGLDEKTISRFSSRNDFPVELTFHGVSASLVAEFAEKIVKPYYNGNLNAAFQDLVQKALLEQDFVLSHVAHIRNKTER